MVSISVYITPENLQKIDLARGKFINRSTMINEAINRLDEEWLKNLVK